jgi:hypothetical protein
LAKEEALATEVGEGGSFSEGSRREFYPQMAQIGAGNLFGVPALAGMIQTA